MRIPGLRSEPKPRGTKDINPFPIYCLRDSFAIVVKIMENNNENTEKSTMTLSQYIREAYVHKERKGHPKIA